MPGPVFAAPARHVLSISLGSAKFTEFPHLPYRGSLMRLLVTVLLLSFQTVPLPAYDAGKDTLYRAYLIATIVGVIGAVGGVIVLAIQTHFLKKTVEATQKSADAAKISADIASRVSVPTLVVEKFGFGYTGSASMAAILQFPNVEVVIKNYGQTPAFLRSWTIIFTCEDLPEIPVYADHPGCGIVLEKEVVKPGESYTLPKLDSFRRQKFSDDDIKAILNREKLFVAYGYICYGDLFGNPLKRHKFCEFVLNIGDNWAQWTESFSGPPYIGTDDRPIKQTVSQQGTKTQPTGIDAKADDHPKKAN